MVEIDTLGKKLITDIDSAYDEAEVCRVNSIQSSVNDIVNEYKKSSLSLFGIANIDAIGDFNQIPIYTKSPSLIKIGYYQHQRLQNLSVNIPAIIDLIQSNGVNVTHHKVDEQISCNLIQNIALRIIMSLPDNLLDLKVFDASSNGANFSLLLALEKVKGNFYASEKTISDELENIVSRLTELQTEKLTFQFNSVEEYNLKNEQKIPYQIIVINNYSEIFQYRNSGALALKKILESSKRFGIFVLLSSDVDLQASNSIFRNEVIEIEKRIGKIEVTRDKKTISSTISELNLASQNYWLKLDDFIPLKKTEIISFLNNRLAEHRKSEIEKAKNAWSFERFYTDAKKDKNFWSLNSVEFVKLPIGFPLNYKPSDSTFAYFHLGSKSDENGNKVGNYHCLIGGETGSGKSVLINNIIVNSCYYYSPDELQFIVIDLKGNEYPEYPKLPHLKVLFQDPSKIDIALNVLEYVKSIYEERVQLFKRFKVNEFSQYRLSEKLPRLICIIDEFQTFNQSDNTEVKRKSAEIIDLIVGKGRSYGIHLMLASQSLANVSINQASMTNINVRLVLRLDELSSKYILSSGNNETLKLPDLQLVYNNTRGYEKTDNKIIKLPFLKGNIIKEHIDFFESKLTESLNYNKTKFLLPGEDVVLLESNKYVSQSFNSNKQEYFDKKIYFGKPYFIKDDDNYISLNPESENNILMIGQDYNVAYRIIFLTINQFLSVNSSNRVYYINYAPKSSKFHNVFNPLLNENFISTKFQDAESIYELLLAEVNNRKQEDNLNGEYLIVLPQLNTETSLNSRNSPLMSKIKSLIETGPTCGIYSMMFVDSYNSLSEIGVLNNYSKFKVALKGGDSHKIMPNKLEVDDNGFVYLSAPTPFTIMNPDYIKVYNSYADVSYASDSVKQVIINLFEKV